MITGIDYLTGEDGIPFSDIRIVSKDETPDTKQFVEVSDRFAIFVSSFTRKYGVMKVRGCPVVLTDETLQIVRDYYEASNGRIYRVSDNKAVTGW